MLICRCKGDGFLISTRPFPSGFILQGRPAQFPLFSMTVTAASVWENVNSEACFKSCDQFYSEQPLGLCLQRLVTASPAWGQKEQALTFPRLSAALLRLEFVCCLFFTTPQGPSGRLWHAEPVAVKWWEVPTLALPFADWQCQVHSHKAFVMAPTAVIQL